MKRTLCIVLTLLAAWGCAESPEARLERLADRLHDPYQAKKAAEELMHLGDGAIPVLLDATISQSVIVRVQAVSHLWIAKGLETPHPRAAARIIEMIEDPDPGVRRAAVYTGREYCSETWDPPMSEEMHRRNLGDMQPALPAVFLRMGDRQSLVRGAVADCLPDICSYLATRDDLPTLISGLNSLDERICRSCATVLSQLGGPAAIEPLFNLIPKCPEDKMSTVLAAADAIYRCDPKAPTALLAALEAPDETRRSAAARALGMLGGFSAPTGYPYGNLREIALAALAQRRLAEDVGHVRDAMDKAIREIQAAMETEGTQQLR